MIVAMVCILGFDSTCKFRNQLLLCVAVYGTYHNYNNGIKNNDIANNNDIFNNNDITID